MMIDTKWSHLNSKFKQYQDFIFHNWEIQDEIVTVSSLEKIRILLRKSYLIKLSLSNDDTRPEIYDGKY